MSRRLNTLLCAALVLSAGCSQRAGKAPNIHQVALRLSRSYMARSAHTPIPAEEIDLQGYESVRLHRAEGQVTQLSLSRTTYYLTPDMVRSIDVVQEEHRCTPDDIEQGLKTGIVCLESTWIAIRIDLDQNGSQLFHTLTNNYIGRRLAFVWHGEVFAAPIIKDTIPGDRVVITGDFTTDEAEQFAAELRSGR